jgi:hypothetical protein
MMAMIEPSAEAIEAGEDMSDEFVIADGRTATGRTLRVVQNMASNPLDVAISIDGQDAALVERPNLYRDGGSRMFTTTAGKVWLPHRIGDPDTRPRLDGEVVTGRPEDQ